ncbi:hypothetical protein HNY73_006296 [Argiope bruennichi]|uniref:Uncharacterized protein n=1 Tax=Argiope bruennichi TaxID=94029 RepID=A0A8T0FLQ2_ARGBR|nr:hypothetical protein HNY73_006296 [Argiope bruennichi]
MTEKDKTYDDFALSLPLQTGSSYSVLSYPESHKIFAEFFVYNTGVAWTQHKNNRHTLLPDRLNIAHPLLLSLEELQEISSSSTITANFCSIRIIQKAFLLKEFEDNCDQRL